MPFRTVYYVISSMIIQPTHITLTLYMTPLPPPIKKRIPPTPHQRAPTSPCMQSGWCGSLGVIGLAGSWDGREESVGVIRWGRKTSVYLLLFNTCDTWTNSRAVAFWRAHVCCFYFTLNRRVFFWIHEVTNLLSIKETSRYKNSCIRR